MDKLVQSTLDAIASGTDTYFGEGALKNPKLKKDHPDDLGHKKGKKPTDGASKPEKMKKL